MRIVEPSAALAARKRLSAPGEKSRVKSQADAPRPAALLALYRSGDKPLSVVAAPSAAALCVVAFAR